MRWTGFKVHVRETCDNTPDAGGHSDPATPPYLITNVGTTHAAVADQAMTIPIHDMLADRGVLAGVHPMDAGYPTTTASLLACTEDESGLFSAHGLMRGSVRLALVLTAPLRRRVRRVALMRAIVANGFVVLQVSKIAISAPLAVTALAPFAAHLVVWRDDTARAHFYRAALRDAIERVDEDFNEPGECWNFEVMRMGLGQSTHCRTGDGQLAARLVTIDHPGLGLYSMLEPPQLPLRVEIGGSPQGVAYYIETRFRGQGDNFAACSLVLAPNPLPYYLVFRIQKVTSDIAPGYYGEILQAARVENDNTPGPTEVGLAKNVDLKTQTLQGPFRFAGKPWIGWGRIPWTTLAVAANPDQFEFFVNDRFVLKASSKGLYALGSATVGVIAGDNAGGGDASCIFDYIRVWKL